MSYSQDLIELHAPGALCLEAMKISKIPNGKEDCFEDLCASGEYFAQEKMDGFWYQYEVGANGEHYLFSRNVCKSTGILNNKIDNIPHIRKAFSGLPNGTIIIGEIYYPGLTSKDVTKVMGCLPEESAKRQQSNPICFFMHDIIYYDGVSLMETPAEARFNRLLELYNTEFSDYSFLHIPELIYGIDIAKAASEILAAGGEGIVMKKRNAIYQPGKRPAWETVKIKKVDYLDTVCIGAIPATVDYTGDNQDSWTYWVKPDGEKVLTAGGGESGWKPITKGHYHGWMMAIAIGAYTDSGELVEIGTISSGLNDELRQALAERPEDYFGKTCMVKCMEKYNDEYTLRHPILIGFREDKDPSDCKIDEIF